MLVADIKACKSMYMCLYKRIKVLVSLLVIKMSDFNIIYLVINKKASFVVI